MRILVVEDNRVNQKVVSIMLQRLGVEAVVAESGEAALERVEEKNYEMVLMDLHMPGMNGCECASHMHEQLGADCPPVIALTADSFSIQDMRPEVGGWAGILSKPVNSEELESCLREFVPGYGGK